MDEEEQKEVRKQELVFEEKYKEIYETRRKFINAATDMDKELEAQLIKEFDIRAE